MPANNDFIDLKEVLKIVPVHVDTVRKARYSGVLRAYKPGKKLFFRRLDVMKWIESTKVAPTLDPRAK